MKTYQAEAFISIIAIIGVICTEGDCFEEWRKGDMQHLQIENV